MYQKDRVSKRYGLARDGREIWPRLGPGPSKEES